MRAVTPSGVYENLAGGYKTGSRLGGEGFDSVGYVSGRKAMQPPTAQPPGPNVPIPTSTQKPNQMTNVGIPYARTCLSFVEAGEVVLLSKVTDAGRASNAHAAVRTGAGTGSLATICSVESANAELADAASTATPGRPLVDPDHPANKYTVDGVLSSYDLDDMPSKQDKKAHMYHPLLNVIIQGRADVINDASRRIQEAKAFAGGVLYVALIAEQRDDQTWKHRFVRFSSTQLLFGKLKWGAAGFNINDPPVDVVVLKAWRVGTCTDTNKRKDGTPLVTVMVDVREMETTFRPLNPRDVISRRGAAIDTTPGLFVPMRVLSVERQLQEMWSTVFNLEEDDDANEDELQDYMQVAGPDFLFGRVIGRRVLSMRFNPRE